MKQLLCHIASSIPTKPLVFRHKTIDKIRNFLFRQCFLSSKGEFFIRSGTRFYFPWKFSIGKDSGIGANSHIYCEGGVHFGNNILTGRELLIHSTDHNFQDKNILISKQGYHSGKVVIEDDVYIGSRVTILKGVRVGKGSVIGAGSVVVKNVVPYTVVGGVPAKQIGERV